ncbi:MAG: hypothetical protein HQL30_09225 [Candidatus Omnitrophica bacterium]|nr:hypothetical protein [Candidatus Omnitrophota bacterium]
MNEDTKHPCYEYVYRGAKLMAVPAVHHQSAFAHAVHEIARDPVSRPDAIAVELGQEALEELVKFLKELGQGGVKKVILTCMLGIMLRNKYIRVEDREKALLLQGLYQKTLADLPDEVLARGLDFSKWSTLFLDPADSIIEAVRSALELDVPVYGVDLVNFASAHRSGMSIEDPQSAHDDQRRYADRVMGYCGAMRDHRIDLARETFMARGLKDCLTRHKKVLFTCGMAHWKSIVSLLEDENVTPFPSHEIREGVQLKRIIIHPSLAAPSMEVLPQVTMEYEKERYPVTSRKKRVRGVNTAGGLIRKTLDGAYLEYTRDEADAGTDEGGADSWSDIGVFEQYLFQLAAVSQRKVPGFSTMLRSSEAVMGVEFTRTLVKHMMLLDPDWASEKDFPELPVMGPNPGESDGSSANVSRRKVRLERKGMEDGLGTGDGASFYAEIPSGGDIDPSALEKYWKWDDEAEEGGGSGGGSSWMWPPCETLLYGLGFKAVDISDSEKNTMARPMPFEGSMESGINVKATMRSMIRGERKVYVSRLASRSERNTSDGIDPEPMVFIFEKGKDWPGAYWQTMQAGSRLGEIVKDKKLFRDMAVKYGTTFVPCVHAIRNMKTPEHLKSLVSSMAFLVGSVLFGNPCVNAKQSAIWIEATKYKCCPIVNDCSVSGVRNYYLNEKNINLDLGLWAESLILMAIPFSKKSVTVIAPDLFSIPPRARVEAARRKVTLSHVPLSHFSEEQVKKARERIMINTLDQDGQCFPPESERVLSQKKGAYVELLPYEMRKQLSLDEGVNE